MSVSKATDSYYLVNAAPILTPFSVNRCFFDIDKVEGITHRTFRELIVENNKTWPQPYTLALVEAGVGQSTVFRFLDASQVKSNYKNLALADKKAIHVFLFTLDEEKRCFDYCGHVESSNESPFSFVKNKAVTTQEPPSLHNRIPLNLESLHLSLVIEGYLDTNELEAITQEPFFECIAEQHKKNYPFILALVTESTHVYYFDANNLGAWIKEKSRNPITNKEICNIFLFKLDCHYSNSKGFEYLGSLNEAPDKKLLLEHFVKAHQGDADSQFALGQFYQNSKGSAKDFKKAFNWFMLSAVQDNVKAQSQVGYFFENGLGIEQDFKKAYDFYRLAAKQGHTIAQYNLGQMFKEGMGVEQNYKKAFKWYLRSANQGDLDAQFEVGICYEKGYGIEKETKQAFDWYMLSANQNHSGAQYKVGLFYYKGLGTEQDLKKAFEFFTLSANKGHAVAQCQLGICYHFGYGVEMKCSKALKWFKLAAEKGHAVAQSNLGTYYYNGTEMEPDYIKAFEWFSISATQGNAGAQQGLGLCYENGHGVEQNNSEAFKWYNFSAAQGDDQAQYKLGNCYLEGKGVKKNKEEAIKWFTLSAKQGNKQAERQLKDPLFMFTNFFGI